MKGSNFKCKKCGNLQAMSPDADLDFETCANCGECGEWLMVRAKAEVVEDAEPMLPAKLETLTAIELFDTSKIEEVVSYVTEKARAHVPDTSTDKGRKAIASNAAQVSRSKTWLESIGKPASAKIKAEAKTLDASRRYMKDALDELRDEMRKPLTDWEAAEKAREAAERLAAEVAADHDAALAEDDLFNRQREIERKEARFAREEEERLAKVEEEKRLAAEKKAKEMAEAAAKAREKELKAKAKEEAEKAAAKKIADAKEAEERAKVEKKQAEEKAEADKKEAAKRAEEEKAAAVAEVKREEQEKAELERKAAETEKALAKKAAEKKAANKKHRAGINKGIVKMMMSAGDITAEQAQKIVDEIAAKDFPFIKIHY